MKSGLERFKEDGERAGKFIGIVKRYTDFNELTATMLNEFVEKIVVHEADRATGRRVQKVEILLNFIGKFDVPGQEKAEPAPFDPVEHRRSIWRDYYQRNREKIIAAKIARKQKKKAEKLAALPVKTPAEIEAEAEVRRQRKLEYHREYKREWKRRRKQEAMGKELQEII